MEKRMELSQNLQISSDEETKGFDLSAGKTWIYPENCPVRDYQFNIVQASLYKNTLVCLPTGLGKTFIAAVVMYNFWRWYPCGKVVFLAPTKPLVAQQIFACHNTMGIPSSETIELTGAINHKQREVAWLKKRVIFATPQVFHNDLDKNIVPSDLVKCVVIDEAHKALGKHSYCECIRILNGKNRNFRVLALSATPGNKIDNVHEVLQNLLIAHIELRDETSLDIIPYINRRKVDIILVPLSSKLIEYKVRYIFIMDRHVQVLLQYNILRGQTANISKGRIFHLLKEYQKRTNKSGQIIKILNILVTMYHAYELMIRNGLRAFYKFYQNHSDKFWMNEEPQLQILLEDINTYLGPFPDINILSEEAAVEISQNLTFGHTKFDKLKELLLFHFKDTREKQSDTRAIVFVEYRDIVNEIFILLLQCQPLIRPQIFVGQAGQKQKQQMKALENFRNNHVNVLISTSIGEEGLDVGEVDLIICFDVTQHSPTRLVQRMGRTGRKRDGHIIILVTDGKEHETLKSTMARRDSLNFKILNTSNIFSSLYENNPRMIPDVFRPECLKMQINMQPKSPVAKNKNYKGKSNKKERKHQKGLVNQVLKGISKPESNFESHKEETKFSMMKYLRVEQSKENAKCSSEVFNSEIIESNNIYKNIPSSDVKILSSDNDGIDFLTTCALRISEKEEVVKNKCKIDKTYIPTYSSMKKFFNFSIPDIKILDFLITLNDVTPLAPLNVDKSKLDDDNKNDNDDNNDLYNNECVFENVITDIIDKPQRQLPSRFEDLLDDSSKSEDEDDLFSALSIASDRSAMNDTESEPIAAGNKNNTLKSLVEAGNFEDILNETSDDSEIKPVENFGQSCTWTKHTNINNDVEVKNSANAVRLNNNFKSKDDIYFEEMIEVSDNFSPIPIVNECERNEEMDDKNNHSQEKMLEIENKRIFSITQAIDEISRLNSNSNSNSNSINSNWMLDESEDDIFRDESFSQQVDDQLNFNEETINLIECKDEQNFDKSKNLNNSDDRSMNTELKVEEFEWNDDFEVSTGTVKDYVAFDKSEERQRKSETATEKETNMGAYFSDDEEWISIEEPINISKENASRRTTIANKLANMGKCWNAKNDYSRNKENDSMNRDSTVNERGTSIYLIDESSDKKEKGNAKCSRKRKKRNRKLKKTKNEFIQEEADVSLNSNTTDESSETDNDLEDFVSYTQDIHDTEGMHGHYLRTIRSPIKRQGGFLFKQPRPPDSNVDVYSQDLTEIHDQSYINDSFCVEEDKSYDQEITRDSELSELERAELKLEKRKRARKRKHSKDSNGQSKRSRRRNIIKSFSSSSEDETEMLRKQIRDESFLLTRS